MNETEKTNGGKITGEPSEMFYEVNRLADRANQEVIDLADRLESEKKLIMENALTNISQTQQEMKEVLEKTLPKELKTIEEEIDLLIEEMEEKKRGRSLVQIIKERFK